MSRPRAFPIVLAAAVALIAARDVGGATYPLSPQAQGTAAPALPPEALDSMLAPIALDPDALLAHILVGVQSPAKVTEFNGWLKQMSKVKGTQLQEAAQKAGFDPSLVALAPFPQVVEWMAADPT